MDTKEQDETSEERRAFVDGKWYRAQWEDVGLGLYGRGRWIIYRKESARPGDYKRLGTLEAISPDSLNGAPFDPKDRLYIASRDLRTGNIQETGLLIRRVSNAMGLPISLTLSKYDFLA